jgi:hypothetical protein
MVHQSDWEVRMHDGLPEFIPPKWIDYNAVKLVFERQAS